MKRLTAIPPYVQTPAPCQNGKQPAELFEIELSFQRRASTFQHWPPGLRHFSFLIEAPSAYNAMTRASTPLPATPEYELLNSYGLTDTEAPLKCVVCGALDQSRKAIRSFTGQYDNLRLDSPHIIEWPGSLTDQEVKLIGLEDCHVPLWPTAAHILQAAKTNEPAWQEAMAEAATNDALIMAGKLAALRPDWRSLRGPIVAKLLAMKFEQHPIALRTLIATYPRKLVSEQGHFGVMGGTYWGIAGGVGENHFGRLLMRYRNLRRALTFSGWAPQGELT